MNFDEAALLWKAVRLSGGPILEIGRRHAGSTVLLATAAPGRRVVSIDLHPDHNSRAEAVLQGDDMRERVALLVGDSRSSQLGPSFGMIFVDGDHSYDGVLADIVAHWPRLHSHEGRPGLAVFHDAVPNDGLAYLNQLNHCPGVKTVCDRLLSGGIASRIESAGSLLVLEKRTELPPDWELLLRKVT